MKECRACAREQAKKENPSGIFPMDYISHICKKSFANFENPPEGCKTNAWKRRMELKRKAHLELP